MQRFNLSDLIESHPTFAYQSTGPRLYQLRPEFQNAHYAGIYNLVSSFHALAAKLHEHSPHQMVLEDELEDLACENWPLPTLLTAFAHLLISENERLQLFGTHLRLRTQRQLEEFYFGLGEDVILIDRIGRSKLEGLLAWCHDETMCYARNVVNDLTNAFKADGARSASTLQLPAWEKTEAAARLQAQAVTRGRKYPLSPEQFAFAPDICSCVMLNVYGQVTERVMNRIHQV